MKPGRYYVEVSFIGYRDRSVKDIEVTAGGQSDLGRIALELKPISVPGVEATAERPAVRYEIDRKVVDVTKLPSASSGTAVDALRNVPSVKVDIEDKVTLRGSSNFKVLIDGKPAQEDQPSDALKQIPSATIQNIEIITNPSAKYDPDGAAGIINVVLKKQKAPGASALVNANAGLRGRYGGDGLLGYKRGIVNSHVGANLNRYAFSNNGVSVRRIFGEAGSVSDSTVSSYASGPVVGGGRAGLELRLGPRDKSSVSGRYRYFVTGGDNTAEVIERRASGESSTHKEQGGWRWTGRPYFVLADHEHTFDTAEHKLVARVSLGGRSSDSTSGWNQQLNLAGDTTYGRRNWRGGPLRGLNFSLEYNHPQLARGKLDAGYKGRLLRTDESTSSRLYNPSTHVYETDAASVHSYNGTEDIHAAYATWSWNRQKLDVQPGFRLEYDDRVISVLNLDSTYRMRRWDYFPGLHLAYALPAEQQVTASYSRRIDRPFAWSLVPVPSWWDARTIQKGNPSLRPQYIDSYEGGYELPFGANSANAGLYYRVTQDHYEQVTYDTTPTVLVFTSRNVGNDYSLGLELSANLSPFKWLTLNPTADLADYRIKLQDQDSTRRSFNWSSSLNVDVHLPSATQLQVNGSYSAPSVNSQGTQSGGFDTDVALKQSFLKRALSITLRV
ncbi:TonB-dependent receptor, partial [candidate division WOR-3 bacterium]|nr:TonB-dependent receptor [candidate division WOR-3 bacterium]